MRLYVGNKRSYFNMKILIIPDIHNKWFEAEEIIDKENPDKVVFLGDYFDDFGDDMDITEQTALWLKKSLTNPDRIHLLGNHDLSYINTDYACAGFTESKLFAIMETKVDLNKLQYYCWVGDWLCTHAGLSYEFYKAFATNGMNPNDLLWKLSTDNELKHRLYQCSAFRGGRDAHAGILWCDYDEFVDIPNVKQIFGHTNGKLRRTENQSICIDTWLKYYAIYNTETNKMRVKRNR